jgi:hypothetical protein
MFNAITINISMRVITEILKINPKFHLETQKIIAKAILSITIPDFKLCYRVIAIKTAWYWHKNRYEDQSHRIAIPT